MAESTLKALPAATVRLIGSSQVITSVFSVVKELVENCLDAEATSIDVKLENYGLDRVEVRDNGCGIEQCNMAVVAKRYHTSKITSFADLEHLVTYGFRGEALGSLCAVCNLSVTTKTRQEDVSYTSTFSHQGEIIGTIPSHLGQGTTICATNLFKNLPVRRQFYNTVKKKKEELKKIEDLLMWYGTIRPEVRLSLKNNKDTVWQKSVMADTKMALHCILGRNVVSQLEYRKITRQDPEMTLEAYLPRCRSSVETTSRSHNDRCFIAVNRRPVQNKELEKCVKQYYNHNHGSETPRYPVFYLAVQVPSSQLDVNLEPNKTRVMLHYQEQLMSLLTELLQDLYGPLEAVVKPSKQTGVNSAVSKERETGLENGQYMNSSPSSSSSESTGLPRVFEQPQSTEEKQVVSGTENIVSENVNSTGFRVTVHSSEALSNSSEMNDVDSGTCQVPVTFDVGVIPVEQNGGNHSTEVRKDQLAPCSNTENQMMMRNPQIEPANSGITLTTGTGGTQAPSGQFDIMDDDFDDLLCTWPSTCVDSSTEEIGCKLKAAGDLNAENSEKTTGGTGSVEPSVVSISSLRGAGETADRKKSNDIDDTGTMVLGQTMCTSTETDIVTKGRSLQSGLGSTEKEGSAISWSKGLSEKQTDGQTVQPVRLLTSGSGKRPLSPSHDAPELLTPPTKKKATSIDTHEQLSQPRLYDVMGSGPGARKSTGFIAFSKEVRLKVVEENQGSDSSDISQIVWERWKRLSEEEREQYEEASQTEIQRLKKVINNNNRQKQEAASSKLQLKQKAVKAVTGMPSIKDQLLSAHKKHKKPTVKSVTVPFSLKQVQQTFNTGLRQSQTQLSPLIRLIGTLKFNGGWICCHGSKIEVLNPHRIEETILYRELMENHVLPVQSLDNPIQLTQSNLGGRGLWQILEDLSKQTLSHDMYTLLEDERLLSNGIGIRCHRNKDAESSLELMGVCSSIPTYGVSDIKEVLELIQRTHAESLLQSRPLKVINYLKSEAVRMTRKGPLCRSRDDVTSLLDQMRDSLSVDCSTCLHNRPFLHKLYDLDNVPLTQSK